MARSWRWALALFAGALFVVSGGVEADAVSLPLPPGGNPGAADLLPSPSPSAALPAAGLPSPSVSLPGAGSSPSPSPASGPSPSLPPVTPSAVAVTAASSPALVMAQPGQTATVGTVMVAGSGVLGYYLTVSAAGAPTLAGAGGAIPDLGFATPQAWSGTSPAFGFSVSGPCVAGDWGQPSAAPADTAGLYAGFSRNARRISACSSGTFSDVVSVYYRLADDGSLPAGSYSGTVRFMAIPQLLDGSLGPPSERDAAVSVSILATAYCGGGCGPQCFGPNCQPGDAPGGPAPGGHRSGSATGTSVRLGGGPLGTASTAADLGQEQLVSTRFHQFLPLGGALPPVERLLGSVWWLFAALTVFALVTLLLRWDSRPATA